MKDVNSCIVESLDGEEKKLLPFLPYLLQDLWEIGASPRFLIQLIKKHGIESEIKKALDLGCGKGVVAIQMAKEFGWRIDGVDAMPAFIQDANQWSQKYKTENLCSFEVGDIRTMVFNKRGYDLVILGSIGPVFGSISETLNAIAPCLNRSGYVLLDDGYLDIPDAVSADRYPNRSEALEHIRISGFEIVDEYFYESAFMKESNQEIFHHILKRALELEEKYPKQKQMFRDYVRKQAQENATLENDMTCITWLLYRS